MMPDSSSPNRDRLVRTARRISPLLGDVVFVGGQMAEILVTEPAAVRVRPTDDVDVVVRVTARTAYRRLQERLAALGFSPDTREGAPICRTRTTDGLVLDVMPLDEDVLGFSNRWYLLALDTAFSLVLAQTSRFGSSARPHSSRPSGRPFLLAAPRTL